jgi:NAD(P)H-dependent FMN reductase
MNSLKIITSTTRPGRKGISIARWVFSQALQFGKFESELLDLAEIGLPLMDEPNHPRQKNYQHEHTKKWSKMIDSADAFIIVLSEYNFSIPAPIKNAIDFLFHEWRYKPVAFVSYGGVSGGLRSTQMMKQVVTSLNMMPISESISIPFFSKYINDEEDFVPDEIVTKSLQVLLTELERWSEALKKMRNQ